MLAHKQAIFSATPEKGTAFTKTASLLLLPAQRLQNQLLPASSSRHRFLLKHNSVISTILSGQLALASKT
jgi:hypothetical protein